MKKSLNKSIILLILTIFTLTTTVFAWFQISDSVKVGDFAVNATSYEVELVLKVNDQILNKNEIQNLLYNTKPSDKINFELSITFKGNVNNYNTNIKLYQVTTNNDDILNDFKLIETSLDDQVLSVEDTNLVGGTTLLTEAIFNPGETKVLKFTLYFDSLSEIQKSNITINGIVVEGANT